MDDSVAVLLESAGLTVAELARGLGVAEGDALAELARRLEMSEVMSGAVARGEAEFFDSRGYQVITRKGRAPSTREPRAPRVAQDANERRRKRTARQQRRRAALRPPDVQLPASYSAPLMAAVFDGLDDKLRGWRTQVAEWLGGVLDRAK
jgi:hypothetical protein